MSTTTYVDGETVRFTATLGVLRTTEQFWFTSIMVTAGGTGKVCAREDLALPDGWVAIRPDLTDEAIDELDRPLEAGELLVVPVDPAVHIERANGETGSVGLLHLCALFAVLLTLALAVSACGGIGDAPDVRGMDLTAAEATLEDAGYTPSVTDDAMFGVLIPSHFRVCDQDAPAGELVALEVSKSC